MSYRLAQKSVVCDKYRLSWLLYYYFKKIEFMFAFIKHMEGLTSTIIFNYSKFVVTCKINNVTYSFRVPDYVDQPGDKHSVSKWMASHYPRFVISDTQIRFLSNSGVNIKLNLPDCIPSNLAKTRNIANFIVKTYNCDILLAIDIAFETLAAQGKSEKHLFAQFIAASEYEAAQITFIRRLTAMTQHNELLWRHNFSADLDILLIPYCNKIKQIIVEISQGRTPPGLYLFLSELQIYLAAAKHINQFKRKMKDTAIYICNKGNGDALLNILNIVVPYAI